MHCKRIARDDTGVSPVIGIMLMISITVVTAAALFYILQGLISDPGKSFSESATPGSWDTEQGGNFFVFTFASPNVPDPISVQCVRYQIIPAGAGTEGDDRGTSSENLVDTYERSLETDTDGDGLADFHVKYEERSIPPDGIISTQDKIWIRTTSAVPEGDIQSGDTFRLIQESSCSGIEPVILLDASVELN